MNRYQARRSLVGMTQKGEGVQSLPLSQLDGLYTDRSPRLQPTPNSNTTSPATVATRSPNFLPQLQGGTNSPNFAPLAQQQQPVQQQQQQPPPPQMRSPQQHRQSFGQMQAPQRPNIVTTHANAGSMSSTGGQTSGGLTPSANASAGSQTYYPSSFQNHMDQLGKLSHLVLRHSALFVLC